MISLISEELPQDRVSTMLKMLIYQDPALLQSNINMKLLLDASHGTRDMAAEGNSDVIFLWRMSDLFP
jgi:hypothetical protein